MSRLNLSLRPAKVGNQIRNNGEMHGEDSVTAMYIPLKDIMLTKEELNILAGDETFWLRRFNGSPDRLPEPLDVADWDVEETFKHKLEGATVRFVYGVDNSEIKFSACTLTKIRTVRQPGGMTSMSCELQTVPVLNESAAKFLSQINHTLQVEITTAALSAKDAQRDLPLADPDATNEPRRDVTRIIDPAQEAQNADTERQLSEALRGLENEKAA
jgi:hypothetical protein